MNRRSVDSVPPVNPTPGLGLGADSFLSSDIPLTPSTLSLVPTPLNPIQVIGSHNGIVINLILTLC